MPCNIVSVRYLLIPGQARTKRNGDPGMLLPNEQNVIVKERCAEEVFISTTLVERVDMGAHMNESKSAHHMA